MDALRRAVDGGALRWIGYLSSTGVYGEHHGGWVDESSECSPTSPTAVRRRNAELEWSRCELPVTTFRLGGIYGPGRSILDAVAREVGGDALSESRAKAARGGRKFTSRCHVGDVVNVLCTSMGASALLSMRSSVYNVVDDEPAPRADAAAYARLLLGLPSAMSESDDESGLRPAGAEGARGEKRVRNTLIKEELGVRLMYPTYREGLRAIAEGDATPFQES
jgi:nucleoside-diphosphate-sugar epimerase